eukprot:CAMPEP_0170613854 /NCGR_PEP_ID=MMETSP0224-20130122/24491_1 /TAXON_ID=285029 /ORGANISM="Togula jolla, Strain CCCM 725" /LENGTH=111 /DNA_ID=CAMNT_0010939477 /DNA_START=263 /DNA_END=598 /DNA_ORIENTATION=-
MTSLLELGALGFFSSWCMPSRSVTLQPSFSNVLSKLSPRLRPSQNVPTNSSTSASLEGRCSSNFGKRPAASMQTSHSMSSAMWPPVSSKRDRRRIRASSDRPDRSDRPRAG